MSDETQDETRYDDVPVEDTEDGSGYEKASIGQRLKGSVAGSGRSLLVAVFAIITGVGISAYYLMDALQTDPPSSGASVSEAPESDASPTGEGGSERYQERVEQENERRVEQAIETGESAIPTLTDNDTAADTAAMACDEQCQAELEAQIAAAEERAAEARQQNQALQEELAALRSEQTGDQVYQPNVYVYEGDVHRSFEAEANRQNRIRSEMQRLAQNVTTPTTHGYATAVGESSGGGSDNGGGRETASANAGTDGGDARNRASAEADDNAAGTPLVPAATTRYATLDTTANSDVPSPVRATIQQGEFAGAKLLGEFSREREYLVIRFTSMTTEAGETYPINAVALDTKTRTVGMADDVDRHTLQKLAAVGGAAFIQGFGEAVQASGQSVQVQGGDTTIESNDALDDTAEQAKAALGRVGEATAGLIEPFSQRPTTVVKYAGTGMSVLFLDPVTTGSE